MEKSLDEKHSRLEEKLDEQHLKLEKAVSGLKEELERRIEDAIQDSKKELKSFFLEELRERTIRQKNLIVYGVEEKDDENSKEEALKLFHRIGANTQDVDLLYVSRLGKPREDRTPRPLLCKLYDDAKKENVFRNAPKLAKTAISIQPDLSKTQRQEYKDLKAKAEELNVTAQDELEEGQMFKVIGRKDCAQIRKVRKEKGHI